MRAAARHAGMVLALVAGRVQVQANILPPTNPNWAPTYDLSESTITMTCNGSGWSSPERGAAFGIVSYDWSNAKEQWAAAKPMDCEKRLQTQARKTKAAGANHVFVYRNVVKALPWFASVREKLDDPQYAGWFLKFSPSNKNTSVARCAAEDPKKCSVYYHDQEQTPAVPTAKQPSPDGKCTGGVCDVGTQPCGEYLFDHRNGSMLREWIVKEHIGGPAGLQDPAIDGFFIDDYWCSHKICAEAPHTKGCPCADPVQGPTEIDRHAQTDMGLSDEDIKDITLAWNVTMGAVQREILARDAYTWSLIPGQDNANASPMKLSKQPAACKAALEAACSADSHWQKNAQLFGLTINGSALPQLEQDIAFFQLARGPFAWLGWGTWGMGWPFNPEPAHGTLPARPHGVPLPPILRRDFGVPSDKVCRAVSGRPGVYERKWSKTLVQLDCNTFSATFTFV